MSWPPSRSQCERYIVGDYQDDGDKSVTVCVGVQKPSSSKGKVIREDGAYKCIRNAVNKPLSSQRTYLLSLEFT
jgi:hypothetical protein